jgi:hypothetical protein
MFERSNVLKKINMNTRDIVLVGAGLVVGYLLVDVINKNKTTATSGASLSDSSSQTVPPNTAGGISNSQNLSYCEQQWTQQASTMRFGSQQQAKEAHDNFITNCLATAQ